MVGIKPEWTHQGECEQDVDALFRGPSRDAACRIIATDPRTMPLRFHENLIGELSRRRGTKTAIAAAYNEILWNMVDWDLLMNSTNTEFAIDHMASIATHLLPKLKLKPNSGEANQDDFTKMLSQLSIQKKNARQLHATGIPWKDAAYALMSAVKRRKSP